MEATQRRLSLSQGVALLTTLYTAGGWFVHQVLRRAIGGDPNYHLIAFPSYYNPAFPVEEYVRARDTLPAWKFDLFYRGIPHRRLFDSRGLQRLARGRDSRRAGRASVPPVHDSAEWKRHGLTTDRSTRRSSDR